MYYNIFVNKTGTNTPGSFKGIINVIDEIDPESLVDQWCEQTLGPKYKLWEHDLKEVWRYMLIEDHLVEHDKLINTIKRK